MTLNKVILIGNLGRDPETHSTKDGSLIVNLNLATSETWKDKVTGERKERVEWHRVVVINQGLSKLASKWLAKGSKVYVEGQLQTRKWTDKSGETKYTTEIVLKPYSGELKLLDKPPERQDRSKNYDTDYTDHNLNDDIPF